MLNLPWVAIRERSSSNLRQTATSRHSVASPSMVNTPHSKLERNASLPGSASLLELSRLHLRVDIPSPSKAPPQPSSAPPPKPDTRRMERRSNSQVVFAVPPDDKPHAPGSKNDAVPATPLTAESMDEDLIIT